MMLFNILQLYYYLMQLEKFLHVFMSHYVNRYCVIAYIELHES